MATDSILSGRALRKLEAVVAFSEKIGQKESGEMTILDKILREKRLEVERIAYREKVAVTSEIDLASFFIRKIIQSRAFASHCGNEAGIPFKRVYCGRRRSSCTSNNL